MRTKLKRIIKEELTKMLSEEPRNKTYDIDGETYTVLYNTYADENGKLRDSEGFQTILDPSGAPIMTRSSYDDYAPIDYETLDGTKVHSADPTFGPADFGLADAVRQMKGAADEISTLRESRAMRTKQRFFAKQRKK